MSILYGIGSTLVKSRRKKVVTYMEAKRLNHKGLHKGHSLLYYLKILPCC